jgi:hypothetical protein
VITCPKCGHENADTTNYCQECGTYLAEGPSTSALTAADLPVDTHNLWQRRDPEPKTSQAILVLVTTDGRIIPLPQVPTVNLGREGHSRASMAAIDLTPFGADRAGVSRLHARIHRLSTGYFIEDCDSTNGTFLNGRRIISYMPQGLAGNDEIQLGQLWFKVTFQEAQ